MIYHWVIGALSLLQMSDDLITSNEVIAIICIQYIGSYIDNGNVLLPNICISIGSKIAYQSSSRPSMYVRCFYEGPSLLSTVFMTCGEILSLRCLQCLVTVATL